MKRFCVFLSLLLTLSFIGCNNIEDQTIYKESNNLIQVMAMGADYEASVEQSNAYRTLWNSLEWEENSNWKSYDYIFIDGDITIYYDSRGAGFYDITNGKHVILSEETNYAVKNSIKDLSFIKSNGDCISEESKSINKIPETNLAVFTSWLDREGLVAGMWQSELVNKMESYTYNGQPIPGAVIGHYYDGLYGGGYVAQGEHFGFKNDYTASEDEKTADYTNSFYTKLPLDGLRLPFGIEFEDSLNDVMAKLGITMDLTSSFTPDDGTDIVMTLYRDEHYMLVFKNLSLSEDQIESDIPYELIFTENYSYTRNDGRESNVTRTVKLTFTHDDKLLHEFSVKIRENYKIR